MIMNRLLLAFAVLLVVSCVGAKEPAPPERLADWMAYYYLDPRPQDVTAALAGATAKGFFENDKFRAPMSGFFAEVFRANPDKIAAWVKPYIGVPNRRVVK